MSVLKLKDDAPRNAQTIIRRIALREPDLLARDIFAMLDGAGVRASSATVSYTVTDLRQVLKLLDAEGLLIRSFERDRLGVESDFIETRVKTARATLPPRNAARGRT